MLWNRLAPVTSSFARQGLSRPLRSNGRVVQSVFKRYNSSPQSAGRFTPDPTDQNDGGDPKGQGGNNDSEPNFKSTILKMLETAATTAASIAILGYGCLLLCNGTNDLAWLIFSQSGWLLLPPVLQVFGFGQDRPCFHSRRSRSRNCGCDGQESVST